MLRDSTFGVRDQHRPGQPVMARRAVRHRASGFFARRTAALWFSGAETRGVANERTASVAILRTASGHIGRDGWRAGIAWRLVSERRAYRTTCAANHGALAATMLPRLIPARPTWPSRRAYLQRGTFLEVNPVIIDTVHRVQLQKPTLATVGTTALQRDDMIVDIIDRADMVTEPIGNVHMLQHPKLFKHCDNLTSDRRCTAKTAISRYPFHDSSQKRGAA